jgi:tripartite-type tricarboxylate transporter receptor subunit TctC
MKHFPRRRFLHLAAGAAASQTLSRVAKAQVYPTRPLRWIVEYPPGGAADTVARIMGQWLSDRLGQPVVIENRAGGVGTIALQAAISAPLDGYTLVEMDAGSEAVVSAILYPAMRMNLLRDGAGVAAIADFPHLLVLRPSFPTKTFPEFIAYAKANPGKITFASYGVGTISHLGGELLKVMAGIDLLHVPYRGSPQALLDLVSGRVDVHLAALPATLTSIQSGAVRALAFTGNARSDEFPDVPTVGEFVHGYEVGVVVGVGVRKGTSLEIIERLNREINAGLNDSAIKSRFAEIGAVPLPITPTRFEELLVAASEKWGNLIRAANIKL